MPPPTHTTMLSRWRSFPYVAMSSWSRSSSEWWPPALPPSIWTMTSIGASASAMASTCRICSTVPGLNATYSMPEDAKVLDQ